VKDKQLNIKSAVIFVFLEYFIGLVFAVAGFFVFSEFDKSSLMTSIFYGFVVSFICMFVGIGLVGYFHLKKMRIQNKFISAMLMTLAGLFLFLLLYILIEKVLPDYLGILAIIIPLTGGVMGFNLAMPKDK
jgi:hypothetical protein